MRVSRRGITVIWLVLVAITMASWSVVHGYGLDPRLASVVVIVAAFVKIHFVIMDFQEVRHAPLYLRWIFQAWVICVPIGLLAAYLMARG